MAEPERVTVSVGGRTLALSNLDKVLYPQVGFTKAQVIDYYARVAPAVLPHVAGRCMSLRRWPDGVDQPSFFTKRCPGHRPSWMGVAAGPGDGEGEIGYCRLDEPAALVWSANLAALELHAPMARADDIESPTMVVFDLDPGPPAAMRECCAVALELRQVLDAVGLVAFAKTSGGTGLLVYVPLNRPHRHRHAADFARAVGTLLAKAHPDRVLVEMTRSLRTGRVFVDWSQNSRHKTTVAAYSLRANPTPSVSTPVDWDEVAAGAAGEPLRFGPDEVLGRVATRGDLFAPTAELTQELPGAP
ncbi:MAG: non-homologous end-joining DNA ligase [Acidimicrobiales bacterium]